MNEEVPGRLCDFCGAPPRQCEATNIIIPLKQCCRCKQCFYHDVKCQRKHYKIHKWSCRYLTKTSLPPEMYSPATPLSPEREWFQVQTRDDGEKGLFTACSIDASPFKPKRLPLKSLVPPVLYETHRKSHCALCFRRVGPNSVVLSRHPLYWVALCSKKCHEASRKWLLDEISCVQKYLKRNPLCFNIFHTSVYVYRLLKNASWDDVLAMRSHEAVKGDSSSGIFRSFDASSHMSLVVEQVLDCFLADDIVRRRIVQRNGSKHLLNDELIVEFFQRIQFNSFSTIVEFEPPDYSGEGLYEEFSYRINHSCLPNAMQKFELAEGQAPQLCIDITWPLQAGKEVYITYGEFLYYPLIKRREAIAEKYNFYCRCARCMMEEASQKSLLASRRL